jgi:hypothetical protein
MPAASQHPSARPAAQAAGIRRAGRRQAIASGRRIGDDVAGAYDNGELRFQGLISAASSMVPNSSARLLTMAEMVCASSGVSRPAPTSSSRSA